VPPGFLENRARVGGEELRLCYLEGGPTQELDLAVAELLADTLLLELELHAVRPRSLIAEDHFVYLGDEAVPASVLLINLTDVCEAFLGSPLVSGVYPGWVTVTRPYYAARYVLMTQQPGVERLADLPPGSRIGLRLGSYADARFSAFVSSLPEDQRWRRIAYPRYASIADKLSDGSLDAAIVWWPAMERVLGERSSGFHVASTAPLPEPEVQLGLILRSDRAFLRDQLDGAIAAIEADGRLASLIEDWAGD